MKEIKLLMSVGRFIWNALVSYAATPQGNDELTAIENELVSDVTGTQPSSPTTSQSQTPTSGSLAEARANLKKTQ